MVADWPIATIEEITERVGMGPFGSSIKVSTFVDKGIPIISGEHLNNTKLSDSKYNFITPEHAQKLRNANVYRGDIIFTHAGNIGQVAYIPRTSKYDRYVISQRQFYMRCNPNKAIPEFVTYFFKSPEGQHKLLANTSQSGVPSIAQPVSYLRTIEIPLPPLHEQRAIAHILGTLDDKIELNRRMNQTLEAMAQALFKNWFVDFEPFRDQGMQDSPLGEIPVGWRVGKLGDIADNPRRSVQSHQIEGHTPYIGLEHMSRRCIALAEWGNADDIRSNKFEFKRGEILFGKLRPYFHKVGIAPGNGVCSTDILVVTPKKYQWFGIVLGHISSDEFINYTDAASSGTKMPRTNWNDMSNYKLALPPKRLAEVFTTRTRPLFDRISTNIFESRTLSDIRDALAPQLLCGRMRVKDAESPWRRRDDN
jgi:type I restriction enzyme S subunit